MDRKAFFEQVGGSLFNGGISPGQRNGMAVKLDAFEEQGIADDRWWAYMLATSYHETGGAMLPVEEVGKGRGKPYGQKRKHDGSAYRYPDRLYYGRGDVQLTWYENYERMGALLGIPLLEEPERALDPAVSARIMVEGMTRGASGRGDFTGLSLEDFFNCWKEDPVGARRVVNGLDRARLIAGYYRKFLAALRVAMVALVLFMAGCKPGRVVTENRAARVDSFAVETLMDSLYRQERQIAFLRTDLQRAREENTRFKGETRAREIRYDTSAPVDSTTGKPPVLSETVTCTRGRYERVVEDDEARQTGWAGTREAVAREHGTRSLAVDHHSTLDAAYEEQPRAPVSPLNRLNARLHRWLFLAGVIVGIAVTVLVNTFLRK